MNKKLIILSLFLLATILVTSAFDLQGSIATSSEVPAGSHSTASHDGSSSKGASSSDVPTSSSHDSSSSKGASSSDVPSSSSHDSSSSKGASSSDVPASSSHDSSSGSKSDSTASHDSSSSKGASSSDVPTSSSHDSSSSKGASSSSDAPTSSSQDSSSGSKSSSSSDVPPTPIVGNVTFTGAISNDFSVAGNWEGKQVPLYPQSVIISNFSVISPSNYSINVTDIYLVNGSLNIQGYATTDQITVDQTSTLLVDNKIDALIQNNGHTVLSAGAVVDLDIINLGELIASGTASFSISNMGDFTSNNANLTIGSSLLGNASTTYFNNGTTVLFNGSVGNTISGSSIVKVDGSSTVNFYGGLQGQDARLDIYGTINFQNGQLPLSATTNITAYGFANITFDAISATLSNSTQILSPSSIIATDTDFALNDNSAITVTDGQFVSNNGTIDINDQATISAQLGLINFENNQILISSNGSITANSANVSAIGSVYLSDSAQISVVNGAFATAVTHYSFTGDSNIQVFQSTHTATDSTFSLQDYSLINYVGSQLDLSNSNFTLIDNSSLTFQNVSDPIVGSNYVASNETYISIKSNSTVNLSTQFTFNDASQLEVDSSNLDISSSVQFNDASWLFVSSGSSVNVISGSSLAFASTSKFTIANSNLYLNESITLGTFVPKTSSVNLTPNGKLTTTLLDANYFDLTFEGFTTPVFDGVVALSVNSLVSISQDQLSVNGGQLILSGDSTSSLAFNTVNITNGNLTLSTNIACTSDIIMDQNSVVVVSDGTNFNFASNVNGGQIFNSGYFYIATESTTMTNTNFINAGYLNIQSDATISQFSQQGVEFNLTDSTLSVVDFQIAQGNVGIVNAVNSQIIANETFRLSGGLFNMNQVQVTNQGNSPAIQLMSWVVGNGTFNGNVVNTGVIGSNSSITQITATTFTQMSTGSLILTVSDVNTYSYLKVHGEATFDGTLTVVLLNPIPAPSDNSDVKLDLISFASSTGKFSNVVYTLPTGNSQEDGCNTIDYATGISITFGCLKPQSSSDDNNNSLHSSSSGERPAHNKMSPGAVVGIIFAVLAFMALLGVGGFFLRKRLYRRGGIREPLLNRKELN